MYISTSYYRVLHVVQELRVFRPHKRGPEAGRTGIPCDIAWNDSSHSILNEFMHAEYGIFVYTIWPLSGAAPHSAQRLRFAAPAHIPQGRRNQPP